MSYKGKYLPSRDGAYEVSRTKLDLSCECARCFWLDRRKGVSRPSAPAYTLNLAVDALLKREFDGHREAGTRPALLGTVPGGLRPARDQRFADWRTKEGVQVHHAPTNFLLYGIIDDLWIDDGGTYYVADYKSTSKVGELTLHPAYRRQMDFYQWLLRRNGLRVSDTAYFVYANASKQRDGFFGRLDFEMNLIAYQGDETWVEGAVTKAHEVLNQETAPNSADGCDHCKYVEVAVRST